MHPRPRVERNPAIVEWVPNPGALAGGMPGGGSFPGLSLETIHDGDVLPAGLLPTAAARAELRRRVAADFVAERDWGADLVARELAAALGHDGFHRVRTARSLLDHGRFPGQSAVDDSHLDRRALRPGVGELFSGGGQRRLLRGLYAPVWQALRRRLEAAFDLPAQQNRSTNLRIAIHTFDAEGGGRPRPELSLLTRPTSCKTRAQLPPELYDPLVPARVAACSVDPRLRDALFSAISRRGLSVTLDDPYTLPDGSLEVRALAWNYLEFLRRRFATAHGPEPAGPRALGSELLWQIVSDVSLERFPTASFPAYRDRQDLELPLRELLDQAAEVYDQVTTFAHREDLAADYLASPTRLSTLVLEVRKDLVWSFDSQGCSRGPRLEAAREIAAVIGEGVRGCLKS